MVEKTTELTDNDIIKALRCCADRYCKGCSEQGKATCRESIAALAWDLIYRQKAEIERLKKDIDIIQSANVELYSALDKARAEAITGFAERLKLRVEWIPWCECRPVQNAIDELAKEMKEGATDTNVGGKEEGEQ